MVFDLVGIEYSMQSSIGLSMPNFYNVFDFNIGDQFVYEYHQSFYSTNPNVPSTSISFKSKHTILTKQVTNTNFSYTIQRQGTTITDTVTADYTKGDPDYFVLDSCNGNLNHNNGWGSNWTIVYRDNLDRLYKVGATYDVLNTLAPNVYQVNVYPLIMDILNYSPSLGITQRVYYTGTNNHSSQYEMVGYVKNNIVFGDTSIVSTVNIDQLNHSALLANCTIYPNPSSELINIDLNTHQTTSVRLSLINLQGQVLLSKENGSSNLIPLPVTEIPNGLYFIVIQTQGERRVEKITINH